MKRQRRSLLPALGAWVLFAASACSAAPPAPDEPAPIAIKTVVAADQPLLQEVEPAAISTLRLVDLAEADGELLLHVDLRSLRRSPLFEAAKTLLLEEEHELQKIRDRCGLDPFVVIDEAAASVFNLDQEEPLVIVRLSIPAQDGLSCLRKLSPDAKDVAVDGFEGLKLGEHRRALIAIAADDLLLVGRQIEIRRALGRRKLGRACEAVNLRAKIDAGADTPFALAVETSWEEVDSAFLKAVLAGEHRLELSGEVRFRDTSYRPGPEHAKRAEEEMWEGRDELRRYLSRLKVSPSLISQLEGLQLKRDGSRLRGSLTITTDGSTKAQLDAALAGHRLARVTEEAKSTVGAIARGAVAAYERIDYRQTAPANVLCGSAVDVPAVVPPGRRYQPDQRAGKDFETGDQHRGWRCLGFGLTQPHRYQYAYRQGGGYKGPSRGGPDPGPDGFEASAEGDIDGDGRTSLFTRVGRIDPQTGRLHLEPLFVDDELE